MPALDFGLLAAIALGFRRTFDHLQITASRDRTTGTLNKAAFQQGAQLLLDRASSADRTVLLLDLDFDGFKAVNDQHGHHAGDKVLDLFAAGAAEVLRRDHCFGRVGGHEFAVAMLVHSVREAQELAQKLHERFSSELHSSAHAVTCSMRALDILHLPWIAGCSARVDAQG